MWPRLSVVYLISGEGRNLESVRLASRISYRCKRIDATCTVVAIVGGTGYVMSFVASHEPPAGNRRTSRLLLSHTGSKAPGAQEARHNYGLHHIDQVIGCGRER